MDKTTYVYSRQNSDTEIKNRIDKLKSKEDIDFGTLYKKIQKDVDKEFTSALKKMCARDGTYLQVQPKDMNYIEDTREVVSVLYDGIKHKLARTDDGQYYVAQYCTFRALDCAVTLKDGTELDPCTIYPHDCDVKNFGNFHQFVAGGAITSIKPSRFLLPSSIRKIAAETPEVRMSTYMPIIAKIKGEMRYLIPPHSIFYEVESFTGRDVDPAFWELAEENRRAHCAMGSSLNEKHTLILADGFDFQKQRMEVSSGHLQQIVPIEND